MRQFLLDTHVVIWMASDTSKLTERVRQIILSDDFKCVSVISVWEVVIKLDKNTPEKTFLDLPGGMLEFYRILEYNNIFVIPVKGNHLFHIPTLPKHHKDPFDRLLISTAITEELTLVTIDENIQKYDVPWVW